MRVLNIITNFLFGLIACQQGVEKTHLTIGLQDNADKVNANAIVDEVLSMVYLLKDNQKQRYKLVSASKEWMMEKINSYEQSSSIQVKPLQRHSELKR